VPCASLLFSRPLLCFNFSSASERKRHKGLTLVLCRRCVCAAPPVAGRLVLPSAGRSRASWAALLMEFGKGCCKHEIFTKVVFLQFP
jgi:hypothetical protein